MNEAILKVMKFAFRMPFSFVLFRIIRILVFKMEYYS